MRCFLLLACCLVACQPAYAVLDAGAGDVAVLAGAKARIEKIRKADATVTILNSRGKPVPFVSVHVEQVRHSFLFGCAALSLLKHPDPAREAEYQKRFQDLFNFATVLTYWQDIDPAPDRENLDFLTAQARRLKAMDIRIKGHPLFLAGACPSWVPTDPDAARAFCRKRMEALVSHFRSTIDMWDVVGDATTAAGAQNGLGAWARQAGPVALTADALRWARGANPAATLLYNDYKLDADYTNLVQGVQKSGAPLDMLGLEAHMIGSEWPLEKVWNTAETFSVTGRPIHFSEVTVLSDDPTADHGKSWPTTPAGEQRQADYVEKLYTVLFSHPNVEAIGWWNFVDGDWDRNPAGFLRADLTPKPVYDRLHTLIKRTWWTTLDVKTARDGTAKFRGFTGRYRIQIRTPRGLTVREAEVARNKSNHIVILIP